MVTSHLYVIQKRVRHPALCTELLGASVVTRPLTYPISVACYALGSRLVISAMNVLLTPPTFKVSIDQMLLPLRSYNSSDGFGRVAEQLNFAAAPSEDEAEYPPGTYLKKGKQDPMSHRIIEKRRRDRMNNCLADLSRLIPPEYLKKGRGRVEKTEIIEMAIRHLKYLQDKANAAEQQAAEEHFRAGYQEAAAEAVRFLVEGHGYGAADGLCNQLSTHLQRHCDAVTKGESIPRDKLRSHAGSSSETASSSSSSHGYGVKAGVIQAPPAPPPYPADYEPERPQEHTYPMDCDRVPATPMSLTNGSSEAPAQEPIDARRKREPTLRTVRREHADDYLHSYKFKNSIERRFSRSQDSELLFPQAAEQARTGAAPHKAYNKRRRAAKPPPAPSTSTSNSGSTEEARDTSPQDTSSESPHHHNHYEKPLPPAQYVPVFALNALGKYYVPLSVEYACLARQLGPYDVLDARAAALAAPLHPVTIHVNFQPCLNYHVKREPTERDWRP
ncbi:transcription factor cwo isoform X2 [Ostrinia furnacalis]|uniref:transcription factor cwo isoform X2 n=1 Tax=Ostrinia furnacalis TaxID=93504 RepID=UPI00103B49D7|nr:transcription factor cwo isoform X2 [Ostrinia furnacalis]